MEYKLERLSNEINELSSELTNAIYQVENECKCSLYKNQMNSEYFENWLNTFPIIKAAWHDIKEKISEYDDLRK